MFTGIIEEVGHVAAVKPLDGGIELVIESGLSSDLSVKDSISINGVCQTVIDQNNDSFVVQAVEETLRKTTFNKLTEGSAVNLERPLMPDSRLDGHIVQGHVDTTGSLLKKKREGTDYVLTFSYPSRYRNLIVGRGSIAIDGISLTVADLDDEHFQVAIIPYTMKNTNLRDLNEGNLVNLEFDILGKYVQRNIQLTEYVRK